MKAFLILSCIPILCESFTSYKSNPLPQVLRRVASSEPTTEVDVETSAMEALAGNIVNTIFKSDMKRKSGVGDGGASGWTSWVDDSASFALQSLMNRLTLTSLPADFTDVAHVDSFSERDEIMAWIRWMKATPSSCVIDLSQELRAVASDMIFEKDLEMIEFTRDEFLGRIGANVILLPSGKSLENTIRTPAGAMAYGKLLYGGVKRYRILPGKMQRRTGEKTALKSNENENVRGWVQYGGPLRNYEALDIGAAAILEVILLPAGLHMEEDDGHMTLMNIGWDMSKMITFFDDSGTERVSTRKYSNDDLERFDPLLQLSGKERNDLMRDTFSQSVGGLKPQVDAIVRRVLDGRVYRSLDNDEIIGTQSLSDAKELESLGLTSVRGLLLYGEPGCGKTLLAREIAKALHARDPKIVAAPELLDKWVGGSEKLIRDLFQDAESELRACGGDATKSSLHVIVIDEIDAVFRKRSSSEDTFATTRASAVNQILTKLDGVNAINNVLLIGMTNRRDLLDEALLRPGRLEVQIQIPKPNKEGRREIFQIHFEALRRRGRLSAPLCAAIDGIGAATEPINKVSSFKRRIKRAVMSAPSNKIRDLAAVTNNFSGADCAGLVRCAGSHALARARRQGQGIDGLQITLEDVSQALIEMKS
jgi:vesicle-fusing ATPase